MEKCGKLWRSGFETADRPEAQGEVYSGAGGKAEMRACSACAGDYEDPDRTAWTPDDPDDPKDEERDGTPRVNAREFPAEE